jgi:hypothetical protein
MVTDGDTRRVRPAGLVSLVAAPLLAFIAAAIAPTLSDDAAERLNDVAEHTTRFGVSVLLTLAALAVFLVAAVALARAVRAQVAAVLAFVGVVAAAALTGINWVDYHLAKLPERPVGVDLEDRITSGAAYTLLEVAALAITVAVVLYAAGLMRRGAAGAATAGAIALGAVLVPIGGFLFEDASARALLLVGYGLLTVGFAVVARGLAR